MIAIVVVDGRIHSVSLLAMDVTNCDDLVPMLASKFRKSFCIKFLKIFTINRR